jgi:hypothetical protein
MTQKILTKTYDIEATCISKNTACEENKRKFRIDTEGVKDETFLRITIDDCFIDDDQVEKCDFAFHRCDTEDFYFVELKGSDIAKAYRQIVTTISQHLKTNEKIKRWGFIVSSRVPKRGVDVNKFKNEFAKKHGKLLFIKNDELVFDPVKGNIK